MIRRPDRASGRRILISTIWHWDLWIAIAMGVAFAAIVALGDDFHSNRALLLAGVPANVAIGTAAWLAGRWVADRLRTEVYGELLRVIDPREEAISLPYQIVAIVALLGAVLCGLVGAMATWLSGWSAVMLNSAALLLTAWATIGLGSLMMLTFRHQRRIAEVQSLKEQAEYHERNQARGECDS